jgi:deoxyribodipyrimidine photolyase-related protein
LAPKSESVATLRLVLGDQLSRDISSLQDIDPKRDLVLIAEVAEEAGYVPHHKKKLVFIFSAMRHFARDLADAGITVRYIPLDEGLVSFGAALNSVVTEMRPERIVMTEASEHRVVQMQRDWVQEFDAAVEIRTDTRFLCGHEEFRDWAGSEPRSLRMENFYRQMRIRTGYLLRDGEPEGGQWNLDGENRKPLPADVAVPDRPSYPPDALTCEVSRLVAERFPDNFGDIEPFDYPVSREDAMHYLAWFVRAALTRFGDYQDAMREGEPLLFHSHLSALINCGLLDPKECCDRAEMAYRAGEAPLNAVEGFIRQIIGWREFVRGVYWLGMPGYGDGNALSAVRKLPSFFWTGATEMNCLRNAIAETKANAYAHHIQRLMVIGNFCLLAGLDPKEVQEWYLLVYHDAYEWVEMPNVVGMILYADGGLFASKPYAASGAYIDRMSDYCSSCHYDVKAKAGQGACPFNYLYWNFLMRNRNAFADNRRMGVVLANLDRMPRSRRDEIVRDSRHFLNVLK